MTAISRKLAVYIITAWVAITVNFLLPHLMPGNPVQTMIGKLQGRVTPQTQKAIELQFGIGLHQSLWSQYTSYWSELFHGNLGQSITLSAPVSTVLGQTLPWTVGLLGAATVISFALGTLAGIALGWRRGSWLDGLLPVSTFFQAVPYFFLGTVLLLVLGSDLHWFPVLGNYARGMTPGFNLPFIGSVLRYAELSAATIVLSSIAGWMLGMRNMTITVMDEDFVLVARAKGLPTRKVISYADAAPARTRAAGSGPGRARTWSSRSWCAIPGRGPAGRSSRPTWRPRPRLGPRRGPEPRPGGRSARWPHSGRRPRRRVRRPRSGCASRPARSPVTTSRRAAGSGRAVSSPCRWAARRGIFRCRFRCALAS
jgi:peptide/nickel transport system permease protein